MDAVVPSMSYPILIIHILFPTKSITMYTILLGAVAFWVMAYDRRCFPKPYRITVAKSVFVGIFLTNVLLISTLKNKAGGVTF